MKSFPSVLALVLCLAVACNAHSGTSSSYKSGFSSQKNNAARSQGSPASAQPRRNTSAMSRDVDQGASRAKALKTLEARRAAANTPPLPPLNDTLRSPQPQPAPVYQAPQPVYQPAPVQSPGNGLMHGLMGFMLGRAMSQSHQPVSYPTVSNGQPQPAAQPSTAAVAGAPTAAGAVGAAGMVGGMPGLGEPAAAAPAPEPSFGASVLRWLIWLTLLSVIVWAAVYSVRKLRRMRAASTPNYSFERN